MVATGLVAVFLEALVLQQLHIQHESPQVMVHLVTPLQSCGEATHPPIQCSTGLKRILPSLTGSRSRRLACLPCSCCHLQQLLLLLVLLDRRLEALILCLGDLERVWPALEHFQLASILAGPRLVGVEDACDLPPIVNILITTIHMLLVEALDWVAPNLKGGRGLKIQVALLVQLKGNGDHLFHQSDKAGLLLAIQGLILQPIDTIRPVARHFLL
mmetsp:Transcript_122234/g.260830  ORF Transcript_122234/g.260830 Transcript_122234/m.260830 type:complete len:215 (+) Transcript_122234:445-1089(+)